MEAEASRMTALLESKLGTKYPAKRPVLQLITTADLPPKPARTMTDDERAWACDEVRMWCRVYGLEPYVRRRMMGYALLEELPDDELRGVLQYVERCVAAIRDEVPFDEAGLI